MGDMKIPEDKRQMVQQMREWLNSHPHLPKDIEDSLLLQFVHCCYYDLDKAKKAAELFVTIRGTTPDIMKDRDPLSTQMQKNLSVRNIARIKISGNRNLWIFQMNDPGLLNYDYTEDVKTSVLVTDVLFLNNNALQEEDIFMLDTKDINLKVLSSFNMKLAGKLTKYQEDAMPIRIKQIHVVNAPSVIYKIFGILKVFLKKEIQEMIHFHVPHSETIFKYLSKEDLPEDFGGTAGKMEDHMKDVMQALIKNRELLKNEKLWCATIEKKSKNKKESQADIPFRSLAID